MPGFLARSRWSDRNLWVSTSRLPRRCYRRRGCRAGAGSEFARASAAGLARLVSLAPHPDLVPTLASAPGYAGWDHDEQGLWPTPTDGSPDHNTFPEPEWADRVAATVRERLRAHRGSPVIGHGDWWNGNLAWDGCDLLAVHDWDSVICQPEPAIAGFAAAEFLGLGGPQGHASVEQSATFLDAYVQARGLKWDWADREVAWAAGLWVRAFDAKEAAQHGNPDTVLAPPEVRARLELAGLNPTSSQPDGSPTTGSAIRHAHVGKDEAVPATS